MNALKKELEEFNRKVFITVIIQLQPENPEEKPVLGMANYLVEPEEFWRVYRGGIVIVGFIEISLARINYERNEVEWILINTFLTPEEFWEEYSKDKEAFWEEYEF